MNFVGEKVKPKSLSRPLVQTAAILGIIQGVLWTSLSSTALFYYHTDENSDLLEGNYLGHLIYIIYLANGNYAKLYAVDIVIGAEDFSYFMYVYLVLSFVWFIVSTVTLWATIKDKKQKHYDGAILAWVITASFLSLLDLILLFILSHDYHIAEDQYDGSSIGLILSAIGIVMTLAARGFVLWVINVVFIVVLSKHIHRRYEKLQKQKPRRNRSVIDGYSGSKAPWQNNSTLYDDTGFENRGYRGDQDAFAFSPRHFDHEDDRSTSRYNSRQPQYGNDYFPPGTPKTPQPRPPPIRDDRHTNNNGSLPGPYRNNEPVNAYQQGRTAKIGPPSGQRSPPLRVNPPNLPQIPDPDYSPPGSPKVRGVLRPNSNYMY